MQVSDTNTIPLKILNSIGILSSICTKDGCQKIDTLLLIDTKNSQIGLDTPLLICNSIETKSL